LSRRRFFFLFIDTDNYGNGSVIRIVNLEEGMLVFHDLLATLAEIEVFAD